MNWDKIIKNIALASENKEHPKYNDFMKKIHEVACTTKTKTKN